MTLAQRAAQQLREAGPLLAQTPVLIGFDGFIDTIYHVVDTRQSASEYSRLRTIEEYGTRILAAAGRSTNIEIVPQNVKLGGNGPIMANAMASLSSPVTYCGMTGHPRVHEVFQEFSQRATLLPLAEPALTDAIEFDDGKLIVGKHATVAEVSFHSILERVGAESWSAAWREARFVGMVNWTMLPHLTELWQHLQTEFAGGERKLMFFDLADPEKRTREDLIEALRTLAKFQTDHDVLLGLNEKEGLQVAAVLEVPVSFSETLAEGAQHSDPKLMIEVASGIRKTLGISACVVHPTAFAAGANETEAVAASGPYVAQPKISTGAGDHFNAGFCIGQIIGASLEESLQIGVGTSGYYVRNAQSPSLQQLAEFLNTL